MRRPTLPPQGRREEDILAELASLRRDDPDYRRGRTWSLVYYLDEAHEHFISRAYALYSPANGLNPTAFRSLKKIESDIIAMIAELFHGDGEVCGVLTSGGTESCLLAVKTYRDYGRARRGIRKPEMILPVTAHVAWLKGAEYFGVKPVFAPLDEYFCVDTAAVERKISRNTVMILGSAPGYPHGIIDPIEKLGRLGADRGVPVHVDACVGGFILPFMEKAGRSLPPWDYRVPGVTSISADLHKYGFAAKGASTITYRRLELLKHQMFVHQDWPGGVFASAALLGTRPGGAYAAAWAAMQKFGEQGYVRLAQETLAAFDALKNGIAAVDPLEIVGEPSGPLLAYRSRDPEVDIFAVGDQMEKRGWHIDRLQMPDALHAMVTPIHGAVSSDYLADLAAAVETVRAHPELAETGSAATYGMIAHVPFRKMVRKQVLDLFAQLYAPGGEAVDLADVRLAAGGDAPGGRPPLLERIVRRYVRFKARRG